jgi:tRNA pseudouridine55 synthase
MPRKPKNNISGWVNLNKPAGITSNDALVLLKRALGYPKIGHAGTLDPLASGVLPIALGEATKLVSYMMEDDKVYLFTVTWGEQRTTDDMEGEVMVSSDVRPSRAQIEAILPDFTGRIMQKPPTFSAIKVAGQRAYDLARAGQEFELEARPIDVYELAVVEADEASATFRAVCGKGTYVRSLARDMARKLGTYGYVSLLVREAVGPFTLENAISLDILRENDDNSALESAVLPIETVLDDIPVLSVNDQEAVRLKNGQKLIFIARPQVQRLLDAGLQVGQQTEPGIAIAMYQGKPLAILEVAGVEAQPVRVFNLDHN